MEPTEDLLIIRKGKSPKLKVAEIKAERARMQWAGTRHADRVGAPRVARPELHEFMLTEFHNLPILSAEIINSPAALMNLKPDQYYRIPAESLGRATGAPAESVRLWLKKWLPGIPSSAYAIVVVPRL